MKEYNAIEQSAKTNGTWMKNSDGSIFNGTPEQFIQQNSSNFKKAFPNGVDIAYRGVSTQDPLLQSKHGTGIFTANIEGANSYNNPSRSLDFTKELDRMPFIKNSENKTNGLHEFYVRNSDNKKVLDAEGAYWSEINLKNSNIIDDRAYIRGKLNKERVDVDQLAKLMEEQGLNNIKVNNVIDNGGIGFQNIVNHRKGNYLKSTFGNNGMFDMSNPNIYKSLIPAGFFGYGLSQSK